MTTNLALRAGHDIAYHTSRTGGGHVGGMAYYTEAAGEPPGRWAGKGAAKLGLAGEVDPGVIKRLFHEDIGLDGERLDTRKRGNYQVPDVEAAVSAYLAGHPFASETELAQVRSAERSKNRNQRSYFDFALGAAKSVSVLHASLLVSAKQARERGDEDLAASLEADAAAIENALTETAGVLIREIEACAAYTRTGYHSEDTGEWRDAAGVTAAIFPQHTSHEGDPHLHAHVTVHNRVQRADGADQKHRTLDSRSLYAQRLRLAVLADRDMETRMTALGWPMQTREDGNGAEVAGVSREVIERFSSRRVAMAPEVARLAEEYRTVHGHEPNARALWLMRQHVSMKQRAGIDKQRRASRSQDLAELEKRVTREEVQALSGVHEAVRAAAAGARPVLDHGAKLRAARIAVAEVQKHHATWGMTQLMFEVGRALPVMPATADSKSLITEVAKLAVSGRAGTEVVQVTAPDIADVSGLGVRQSDGGSIYRPPQGERWTTLPHLDTEEQILGDAKRKVPQLVSEAAARSAVAETDLTAEQAEAVVTMLTATTATTALIAPAGAGKSHTMAVFARLWTSFTGRRVIGLTTSTNAARVLQNEGLAESYNIAEFLGKNEGTDELRRPVPLHRDDVLVLDEATQAATNDFAMVQAAARQAGARVNPVGDTQQLGSPEAGGMFRLLAQEVPDAELHEVRRFDSRWEAGASARLREGDFTAIADYDRRGRIRGADEETAMERAATAWLADHLRGKDTILLAGSNAEAAELARRVQDKLLQMGRVQQPEVALADGNRAGTGDRVRARLNTKIDAGGQKLANRDTLKITALRGADAEVRRLRPDRTWTEPLRVPRSYLTQNAELDYAGNVHVAQGRTTDTANLYVSETLSRQSLYVGMTRGRESNTAHVSTGNTAPPGHEPYEQAAPESVLKSVMQRDRTELSATEQIRMSQEWATGSGHLLSLWSAAARPALYPQIDEQVKARLTEHEAWRYDREHSRTALQNRLREHQLAGHDLNELIGQITAAPLDGARSVSSVLHGRLESLRLPESARDVTWAARTPQDAPRLAHELAEGLDQRRRELGERLTAKPEPWLASSRIQLEPGASAALRADYMDRAGRVAAYREAAGITDPEQAISLDPHPGPELETMRLDAAAALEIPAEDVELRKMSRGELEARVLEGERAQAAAPQDVSGQLRLTAQAEADAWQQSADAEVQHDTAGAAAAGTLASQMAAEKTRLEAANAQYEHWSANTAGTREAAGKAQAELARRGQAAGAEPQPDEPQQTTAGWWAELERDLEAADRALATEHAQAEAEGRPWPPRPEPQPEPVPEPWSRQLDADIEGLERALEREHQAALDAGEPWPPKPGPGAAAPEREPDPDAVPAPRPSPEPGTGHDGQAARLDDLQARAGQAAERLAAENAGREARAEYAVRIEQEAQLAGLSVGPQAEAEEDAEIEL